MYEIVKQINKIGVNKIRFLAPMKEVGIYTPLGFMTSSNDPDVLTTCKITEERYRIKDNYKISITPTEWLGYTEHHYLMDFDAVLMSGYIKIITQTECNLINYFKNNY
jgi:hypothetical protein